MPAWPIITWSLNLSMFFPKAVIFYFCNSWSFTVAMDTGLLCHAHYSWNDRYKGCEKGGGWITRADSHDLSALLKETDDTFMRKLPRSLSLCLHLVAAIYGFEGTPTPIGYSGLFLLLMMVVNILVWIRWWMLVCFDGNKTMGLIARAKGFL